VVRVHPAVPENHVRSANYARRFAASTIWRRLADLARTLRTAFIGAPPVRKSRARRIIEEGKVESVFDETRVRVLATTHELPARIDLSALGAGIREAAKIFAREARIPNGNELHDEISNLHKLADRRLFQPLASALETLSPQSRELLTLSPVSELELPLPDAIRDIQRREIACDVIATICRFGGRLVQGRRRPDDKRSRPIFEALVNAPRPRRHFSKRDAERNFVMWLQVVWLEATGKAPPHTARQQDPGRGLGPFGALAKECLEMVGAGDANVVELINELERQRTGMQGRVGKHLSGINP
jgi:hypothetical protein